ncbi:tRNA (N(6)-L-threonylcarbamoyladenosine(37)-C(2))-methylthiotransferase [Caldisphaera lagunensis]|uniref:tRNA (N(6)-L-threonylcarbamoyladenosine(37)-C(2))- methylthiotransferase n=1 Tax=Caldisphaera lagunensis TaxID=200415 RepID=UPI001FDF3FC4|nr:tRNA (N(6)-L-threonylcarbamoyladenosine(37)-C(2))-methylthiotransferase [Caldisphaera lagunensis]
MKKYYIETFGCALSEFDSSTMDSILSQNGYVKTEYPNDADIIIVNTCAVRLDTEAKIMKRLNEIKNYYGNARLIVSGCLAKARPSFISRVVPNASLVSPQNSTKILDVVKSENKVVLIEGNRDTDFMPTPPIEDSVATIMIEEGCVDNCSFCITKLARQTLKSYKPRVILDTIKKLVEKGVKEIRLTGQDIAAYGLDFNPKFRLDELINIILDKIKGEYRIRIGMMTPDKSIEIIDNLLELYKDERIFKFFHIPVQSGDNNMLKIMNRNYSIEEYKYLHNKIKSKYPNSLFATDIIVGHPGENEEAFQNTVKLVKELRFERVYLAQYSIRPRTKAASMEQVPEVIKKKRSLMLNKVIKEIEEEIYKNYIGKTYEVLITTHGFRENYVVGRLNNYFPVAIKGGDELIGKMALVRINKATYFDLRGEVIEELKVKYM